MEITFKHRQKVIKTLDLKSCVKFAIYAANLVKHLNSDPRVENAIEAAQNWVNGPSEKTQKAAWFAAYAAGSAALLSRSAAGFAANAAADAANAAASRAAAKAAADAAEAAYRSAEAEEDREEIKQKLVNYLKELVEKKG